MYLFILRMLRTKKSNPFNAIEESRCLFSTLMWIPRTHRASRLVLNGWLGIKFKPPFLSTSYTQISERLYGTFTGFLRSSFLVSESNFAEKIHTQVLALQLLPSFSSPVFLQRVAPSSKGGSILKGCRENQKLVK